MTDLYLIRHGDYVGVEDGYLTDMGLSPLGLRQVERLRDRLSATHEIAADVLISSTMPRALQTAGILASTFGLPVAEDPDVQEWHNDETEPITPADFHARLDTTPRQDIPFLEIVPGAETRVQFMTRVGSALHRIIREHEGKVIVVVCHGGIVEASFHYFFGLPTLRLPNAYVDSDYTAITHWKRLEPRPGQPIWMLARYNDALHLRDLDTPVRIPWADLSMSRKYATTEQLSPVAIEE
ncbi:MAG: histidine phosphatase family protein [Ktedonobacterales bacterium]